uniref:Putative addiction module component, TIGR02574 family n=1 Tax=Candidatus Kentrum sp. LPFa TaxID=2126335 RepID=A0A450W0A6_9GAMM|nr:MAG: putative addiction module component, TIGR02574 family [Candidatus Kentron sp. LPFa]VFK26902.1 MAG: putative addiction module component, TIGR02574 family [Candidatus Kentron sp. LPFa]
MGIGNIGLSGFVLGFVSYPNLPLYCSTTRDHLMNTQLLIEAKKLPLSERINLIEAIWDTVAPNESEIPLTDAQKNLLNARLAEYETDPVEGSSWEDVRTRLEQRTLET